MKRSGKTRIILLLLCLLILLFPVEVVRMTTDNGQEVFQRIRRGEYIQFTFLHSYYHVYQREYYLAQAGGLVLDRIEFDDYQAASYWDPNRVYEYEPTSEVYYLNDISYRLSEHLLTIAHHTDYSMKIGQKSYDLNALFPDANRVVTTVDTMPLMRYFWRSMHVYF